MQSNYQNKLKSNVVYSRTHSSKIKNCAYVINLDEHKSVEVHWIDLYVKRNKVTYFDSFGEE